jgi:hypothetical protein
MRYFAELLILMAFLSVLTGIAAGGRYLAQRFLPDGRVKRVLLG